MRSFRRSIPSNHEGHDIEPVRDVCGNACQEDFVLAERGAVSIISNELVQIGG